MKKSNKKILTVIIQSLYTDDQSLYTIDEL